MSTVDDVWERMQEESRAAAKSVLKASSKKKPAKTSTATVSTRAATTVDKDKPDPMNFEQFLRLAKTYSLDFESESIGKRKSALTSLLTLLEGSSSPSLSETEYSALFRDICKPLFKKMSDSYEICRELSLRIIRVLFSKSIDLVPVLGYFFPCLLQRMPGGVGYDEELKVFVSDIDAHEAFKRGRAVDRQDKGADNGILSHTVVEPSEEIRLLLCQTIEALLLRLTALGALAIVQSYFSDVVLFLQTQLRDPYPELKMLACTLLELMACQSEFEIGMKFYSVGLVRAVLPVLRHRHAKVRVVAVRCCTACMVVPDRDKRKAAGTEALVDVVGFREDSVLQVAAFYKADVSVNHLAELVRDGSVQVREALIEMLTTLLTQIEDRYDHQQRLLPYVLDLLSDDCKAIADAAFRCLGVCGMQYEEENAESVLQQKQYGIDGDEHINLALPPPPPFTTRPSLGIRLYVRGNTKRFLHALLNELTNWISKTRLQSARLLKVVVVLCEEHLTMEAYVIIPALIKAVDFAKADKDISLERALVEVLSLLGRYFAPETYVRYILPRIAGDPSVVQFATDAASRCTVLEALGAMLSGSKALLVAQRFVEVADVIADPFVVPLDSVILRRSALAVLEVVLDALTSQSRAVTEAQYTVKGRGAVIKKALQSLIADLCSDALHTQAVRCMRHLAKQASNTDVGDAESMFTKLGVGILQESLDSYDADPDWTPAAPSHLVVAFLLSCPYVLLSPGFSVNIVFSFVASALDPTRMRVLSQQSVVRYMASISALVKDTLRTMMYGHVSIAPSLLDVVPTDFKYSHNELQRMGDALRSALHQGLLSSFAALLLRDNRWASDPELQRARFDLVDVLFSEEPGLATIETYLTAEQIAHLVKVVLSGAVADGLKSGTPVDIRSRSIAMACSLLEANTAGYRKTKLSSLRSASDTDLGVLGDASARYSIRMNIELLVNSLEDPDDGVVLRAVEGLHCGVPFLCSGDHSDLVPFEYFVSKAIKAVISVSACKDERFVAHMDYLLRSCASLDITVFERILSDIDPLIALPLSSKELLAGLKDHVELLRSIMR